MTHHLSLVVAIPVIGALLLGSLPRARSSVVRAATTATAALVLAVSLPLWFSFAPRGAQWQLIEQFESGGGRFVRFTLGLDGFGLVFVLLTALLSLVGAVLLTDVPPDRTRRWGIALLLIEAGTIGVFVSLELWQLFLFWLLAVGALALATIGAGDRRAGIVMTALIVVAAAAMFAGVRVLGGEYRALAAVVTVDVQAFQTMPARSPAQMQAFALLAIGCVMPIVLAGIHVWSAANGDGEESAPIVAGMLVAPLTVFSLLRMILPVMPQAARAVGAAVTMAGVVAGILAIAMAWRSRARAAIFWIALGQVMVAIVGVSVATPEALTGGTVQVVAAALTIAALLPVARHTVEGARSSIDVTALVGVIAALAGGFTAARLIATGAAPVSRTTAVMSVLVSVAAGIALIAISWRRPTVVDVSPTTSRRTTAGFLMAVPAALLFALALHPAPMLSRLETSVARVIVRVSPEYASQVADCLNQPPPAPPPDSGLPPGAMLAAPCNDAAAPAADPNHKR